MLIFYLFPRKNEEPLTSFVNDNLKQHIKKQRHYFATTLGLSDIF